MARLIDPARALLALALAYVAVSTVGFGIYLLVAELMGHSPWTPWMFAITMRINGLPRSCHF